MIVTLMVTKIAVLPSCVTQEFYLLGESEHIFGISALKLVKYFDNYVSSNYKV